MRLLSLILCLLISLSSHAYLMRPDAPSRYVVKPGDTLWDIANCYLEHPWEWEALWHANPKIKNPNHLYPGAIIELHYEKDKPYLLVSSNGTVKLSPTMHTQELESAILPIPLNEIRPFLNASLVLDYNALQNAPHVVGFRDDHMMGGQGMEVYVKNLCPGPKTPPGRTLSYSIYRPTGEYANPATKEFLGYKATLIGYAELIRKGDPATIVLTDILQGVKLRDRVMSNLAPDFDIDFIPKTPNRFIRGLIIDTPGDYTQGSEGLVVVLDRGKDAGLQPGDVLAVYRQAHKMKDVECPFGCVRLPRERVGEVMVFRTFTKTSFAMVVRATRAVKVLDRFGNP